MATLEDLVTEHFRAGNVTSIGQLARELQQDAAEVRKVVLHLERVRALLRDVSNDTGGGWIVHWRWNPQEPRFFCEEYDGISWRVVRRNGQVVAKHLTEFEARTCVEALNALEKKIDRGVTRTRRT